MALTVGQLIDWQPPNVEPLVGTDIERIIMPGSRTLAFGAKKSFKSMLVSLNMAYCLATGTRWLGKFPCKQSTVLVIQVEIPQWALRERIMSYSNAHGGIRPSNLIYETARLKLARPYDWKHIKNLVEHHNADVLMLDPMYKLMIGDINSNEQVAFFTDQIDRLQSEVNVDLAIVLIHHMGKKQFDYMGRVINRGTEATLGGSVLLDWYDSAMAVSRDEEDKSQVMLSFEDMRLAKEEIPGLKLRYLKDSIDFVPEQEELQGGLL